MALPTKRISALPAGTLPLTGSEAFEADQAGHSVQLSSRSFVLPTDSLITFSSMGGSLPGSRQITSGVGIGFVDNGAGNPFVIFATGAVAGPANPTGVVGLATVNGVALTYMRSDAAPPISQAILPTWTNLHTFNGGLSATNVSATSVSATSVTSSTLSLAANDPTFRQTESDAAANNRVWEWAVIGEQYRGRVGNDALGAFSNWITVDRTLNVIDSVALTSTALTWNGSAIPSVGTLFANPTGTIGLAVVNGSATTALRSDAAPALSQAIVPTWSGKHVFSVLSDYYPITAVETAGSAAPTALAYSYLDPRRAKAYYPSAGWTDFGDVPTRIDATHFSVPGDQTPYFTPQRRVMILAAASRADVRIVSAVFGAVTTVTILSDIGDTVPATAFISVWLQTGVVQTGPSTVTFNKNSASAGLSIFNLSTGVLSSARFAAFTTDASGVANSAVALVAVSPNYSTPFLANGFATGTGRAVLYTPPSYHLEIGTSDSARLKIDANGLITAVTPFTGIGDIVTPSTAITAVRLGAQGGTLPMVQFVDSAVAADQKISRIYSSASVFNIDFVNDAYAASASVMSVTRTGVTPQVITLGCNTRVSGTEMRLINNTAFYSGYNTANTTRSGYLQFSNSGSTVELASEVVNGNLRLVVVAGGTGTVDFIGCPTGTTVGAAGGATALPATPIGYLTVRVNSTNFKIPYYNT